ncbi:MAG: tRNA (N(6)-L-threonylcarbamoyladenosine(37)-C(2))-methylthiotransferase MtaB [Bacillota bacterium]|nr:tRNA (N(6)-L-threonylcarbamoyladenosine(37)-C(2))-methylthiotransferase MtaB [Bacillota bacterium]
MTNNKTFAVYTLGCKVNSYETDCLVHLFEEQGCTLLDFEEKADIYLINTCSVTNTGDKKSRQAIHRARRTNPDAFIAVCGCYAQADPSAAFMAGADLVAGTSDRAELVNLALSGTKKSLVRDISKVKDFEELPFSDYQDKTRAYIKIQDGCNNFCSYCIIPYTRGRVRSRSLSSTLEEAKRLTQSGYKEIVLTGIEVYSYGADTKETNLLGLLEKLQQEARPERIRLSSIDPRAFTDEFIEKISRIPSLCDHFHISAQSGSNNTLKRMNRPNTGEEFLAILSKIRRAMPGVSITTDIITGFPGETEEEFEETKAFIKEAAFSRLHVFPYSERKGTKAAQMEQLPMSIRSERAKVLIAEGKVLMQNFALLQVGKTLEVLFEQGSKGVWEGYSKNYVRVFAESGENLEGQIKKVLITKAVSGGAVKGIIC